MKEKWVENDFEVKVEQISNCQSRGGGAHIISLSSDFKLASTVQIQWSGVQSKYSEVVYSQNTVKYSSNAVKRSTYSLVRQSQILIVLSKSKQWKHGKNIGV